MKKLEDIEVRVTSLELKSIDLHIFCWILLILVVLFFSGFIFGNYYTEEVDLIYSCEQIEEMIILNDFPNYLKGRTYVDTFYRKGLAWSSVYYSERDFRDYYLLNCKEKRKEDDSKWQNITFNRTFPKYEWVNYTIHCKGIFGTPENQWLGCF